MTKKILLVDDQPTNLKVLQTVLSEHYKCLLVTSGEKAIEAAEKHQPDIILLDIMMPGMNGYEVCLHLKSQALTCNIPVIFVTAMNDIVDEAKGFDVGAVDYIQKPISAPIVLRRVQTHLSLVRVGELEKSQKEAIYMLGQAGHYNDNDTGQHIWRMACYSEALAKFYGWSEEDAELLKLAAPMHDTGKIGTPDNILKAPRKLSDEEWTEMKKHTEIGFEILSKCNSNVFNLAAEIALCHHEWWDGSGYPSGLSGYDIPESARIVAIADVFDALTMKRPYKKEWSTEEAFAEIHAGSGKHFEPKLVSAFEENIETIMSIREEWSKK